MTPVKFCTVINCMDGRIQTPVILYLQKKFLAKAVDNITEPGPARLLAERKSSIVVRTIMERLKISVEQHNSVGIAVVAHHDCAGHPAPRDIQEMHLQQAVQFLREKQPKLPVIGLYVDEKWRVREVVKHDGDK